jgi:hypothetical protein
MFTWICERPGLQVAHMGGTDSHMRLHTASRLRAFGRSALPFVWHGSSMAFAKQIPGVGSEPT